MELPSLDPTELVFYLAIFFLISFLVGQNYNRKLLNQLRQSFSQAISHFDSARRVRPLGSKAMSFYGERLGDSIGEYSLFVILIGRENPLTWAVARLAGRLDIAVLRARAKGKLRIEFDILSKGTPPYRQLRKKFAKMGDVIDYGEAVVVLKSERTGEAETKSRDVLNRMITVQGFWSLSVRKSAPNVILNFSPAVAKSNGLQSLLGQLSSSLAYLSS